MCAWFFSSFFSVIRNICKNHSELLINISNVNERQLTGWSIRWCVVCSFVWVNWVIFKCFIHYYCHCHWKCDWDCSLPIGMWLFVEKKRINFSSLHMFNKQFNCPVAGIFSPYWIAQRNNGIYSCISSPSLFFFLFFKNVNKYEWSRKNKGCASIYPESVGKIANIMHTICTNAFGIYKIQTPSSFNWNITVMELTTLLFYIIFVVISLKSLDRLSYGLLYE